MQPRLTRSTNDTMIAGVCGGLGEYFNIDPVIVRLIFVLVTLTSGLGLPVYVVLLLLMPKDTSRPNQQHYRQRQRGQLQQTTFEDQEQDQREVLVGQRSVQAQRRSAAVGSRMRVPAPPEYRFDPMTGEPITPASPAMGQTVNLGGMDVPELPAHMQNPRRTRTRNWGSLGVILIGIGGLIFLDQLGINLSLLFPILMIAAGMILLRRSR